MSAEAVGLSAIAAKYIWWVVTTLGGLVIASLSYIVKEKNEVIKKNQDTIHSINVELASIKALVVSRDHEIEELSAQVGALSEIKDKVLIMGVQMENLDKNVTEMKQKQN